MVMAGRLCLDFRYRKEKKKKKNPPFLDRKSREKLADQYMHHTGVWSNLTFLWVFKMVYFVMFNIKMKMSFGLKIWAAFGRFDSSSCLCKCVVNFQVKALQWQFNWKINSAMWKIAHSPPTSSPSFHLPEQSNSWQSSYFLCNFPVSLMISEKVQVLIASFFEMYEEIALHTFVLHADSFLGCKAKMLRQFCKTGWRSKFSSLHKEFRTCSCTVTTVSMPAT